MPAWSSYAYVFGPLTAFLVVGVLALLLRWAFGGRSSSLVAKEPRPGTPSDYGMLVSIASPSTYVEGELLRRALAEEGLRATLTTTTAGPRLLVFATDEAAARSVLARRRT